MRTNPAQVGIPASSRIAIFLAASALLCATEMLPTRAIPQFSDYPFDEWAAAPEHASIRWDVHLLPAQLSVHQRLLQRVEVVVPGGELAKRRGRGELILLTRFEDSDGRQWRTGNRLNLAHIEPGVKADELTFTTAAFVKPGDYRVSIALADSATLEHNFTNRALHVAALKSDPLPDSWAGLPPVEILPGTEGPDSWFLPAVKGLLKLSLRNHSPAPALADAAFPETGPVLTAKMSLPRTTNVAYTLPVESPRADSPKIDLLVNITPSERFGASAGTLRRNMSAVIPALKVLSALNAKVHSPSASVMDLTRHRIGFETSNAASLDWSALGKILTETNPGIIDAKVLANESSTRDYFIHEVAGRAGDSGPPRWLIVMSGSFSFRDQEEMTPIPTLAPDPNRHIVYLRFLPDFNAQNAGLGLGPSAQIAPVRRVHGPMPGLGTVIPFNPARGRGRGLESEVIFADDFEHILKTMGAQTIVISNPESFRKTIASLIDQIPAN